MKKNTLSVILPVMFGFLAMGFIDMIGLVTSNVRADFDMSDGLVNTISERAPFGAPQRPLDRDDVQPGVWNVMDDLRADHSFFSGGYMHKVNPHFFFQDLQELLLGLV